MLSRPHPAGGGRRRAAAALAGDPAGELSARKAGQAMAAFGMGVVVAPIARPDPRRLAHRQLLMALDLLHQHPRGDSRRHDDPRIHRGPALHPPRPGRGRDRRRRLRPHGAPLATLQIILDKGQQDDWFAAAWIRWFRPSIALSLVAVHLSGTARSKHPLVDLRVLRNRNFAVGTTMMTLLGVVLYSTITLLSALSPEPDGLLGA